MVVYIHISVFDLYELSTIHFLLAGNYGSRKATLNSRDIGQREEFAAADAEPLLVSSCHSFD